MFYQLRINTLKVSGLSPPTGEGRTEARAAGTHWKDATALMLVLLWDPQNPRCHWSPHTRLRVGSVLTDWVA